MAMLTTKEFIKRSKKKHGKKYDYSKVEYLRSNLKVKIICPTHGEFEQRAGQHVSGHGCPKCKKTAKMTTEEWVAKAKIKRGDRYDYSKVVYIGAMKNVIIICKKHGEFLQSANNHLNTKRNCPKCSPILPLTTEQFIERAIKVHGDTYNYSKVEYKNKRTKVKIICKDHGVFEQTPHTHLYGNSARTYVKARGSGCTMCKTSSGELKVLKTLKQKNIKFETQKTFKGCVSKNKLPFDFYLSDYNTCIEFDGVQHFHPIGFWGGEEGLKSNKKRDKIKTDFCKANNIKLVRIKYDQIDDIEKIINKILKHQK